MRLADYLLRDWDWNPLVIAALVLAAIAYVRLVGRRGRPWLFASALVLVALAFLSPLNLLAAGVLFSAHMAQHIILLLLVPGLVLLSLPVGDAVGRIDEPCAHEQSHVGESSASVFKGYAIITWSLGVGSMWFWHVPQFCNAAASSSGIHTLQTVSLLGLGAAFWWPILAPRPEQRLGPGMGIGYLFTACLACTGLGILLTLTTVDVCPIFRAPSTAPAMWVALRDQLSAHRDQQIGGLLMWMPMCLVYVAAIVLELARWLGEAGPTLAADVVGRGLQPQPSAPSSNRGGERSRQPYPSTRTVSRP